MELKLKFIFWLVFAGAVFVATGIFVYKGKPLVEFSNIPQPPNRAVVVYPNQESLKILFGGDVFLDRSVRRSIESGTDVWAPVENFLKSYKYKVANLEGPIKNKEKAAPNGSFSFSFQEEYIDKLKDLGFTALSLANNHTLNEKTQGLVATRGYLQKIGISYFGDPNNEIDYCCLTYIYENGELKPDITNFSDRKSLLGDSVKRIAFVGELDLYGGNGDKILKKIKELKAAGSFVIVYPHWGVEYETGIAPIEQKRAHELIDAGADLVIGSHPHVVQPIEEYKGKIIFYSLGNFLFDQHFSYDTLHGLLVEVEFTDSGLKFTLFPTEQDKKTFQISLAGDDARKKMLDRLAEASLVPANLKQSIKSGKFAH